jgi:hypothetical protein
MQQTLQQHCPCLQSSPMPGLCIMLQIGLPTIKLRYDMPSLPILHVFSVLYRELWMCKLSDLNINYIAFRISVQQFFWSASCHLESYQVMLPTIFTDFPRFVGEWGHHCKFETCALLWLRMYIYTLHATNFFPQMPPLSGYDSNKIYWFSKVCSTMRTPM